MSWDATSAMQPHLDARDLPSTATTLNERAESAHAVPYRSSIQTHVDGARSSHANELQLDANNASPLRHHSQALQSRSRRRLFPIATDPAQDDKAREIRLCNTSRPHMRAFHFAWLSFFVAFFGWFSIPPLLPTIQRELQLTKSDVDNSSIVAVASTIVGRVITGPLCDRYGPRAVQATLLVVGAIPVAAAALVTNYTTFLIVRFCIGIVGCSFVATTYWTSVMFCSEIVGRANALAAGWGNLGAGATYLITPVLFDLFTASADVSDNTGWRLTLLVPAIGMVAVGVCLYYYADDCPHGDYADFKPTRASEPMAVASIARDVARSVRVAIGHPATWILAYQYACSFGVELIVHNVLSLRYYEDFTRADCDAATDAQQCRLLTQTTASLIASLFGLMCIVARAAGGYASDVASLSFGMPGRIKVHCGAFVAQSVLLYMYSRATDLSWSIACLVAFAFCVQACTGTTYAIVPYVLPHAVGAVSGFVAAGGNVGGMVWGFLFRIVDDRSDAFQYLSIFTGIAAAMALLIDLEGYAFDWRLAPAEQLYSQTSAEHSRSHHQQQQQEQEQMRDGGAAHTQFDAYA